MIEHKTIEINSIKSPSNKKERAKHMKKKEELSVIELNAKRFSDSIQKLTEIQEKIFDCHDEKMLRLQRQKTLGKDQNKATDKDEEKTLMNNLKKFIIKDQETRLKLDDTPENEQFTQFEKEKYNRFATFSPNSLYVLTTFDEPKEFRVHRINEKGIETTPFLKYNRSRYHSFVFSPNSRYLFCFVQLSSVDIFDMDLSLSLVDSKEKSKPLTTLKFELSPETVLNTKCEEKMRDPEKYNLNYFHDSLIGEVPNCHISIKNPTGILVMRSKFKVGDLVRAVFIRFHSLTNEKSNKVLEFHEIRFKNQEVIFEKEFDKFSLKIIRNHKLLVVASKRHEAGVKISIFNIKLRKEDMGKKEIPTDLEIESHSREYPIYFTSHSMSQEYQLGNHSENNFCIFNHRRSEISVFDLDRVKDAPMVAPHHSHKVNSFSLANNANYLLFINDSKTVQIYFKNGQSYIPIYEMESEEPNLKSCLLSHNLKYLSIVRERRFEVLIVNLFEYSVYTLKMKEKKFEGVHGEEVSYPGVSIGRYGSGIRYIYEDQPPKEAYLSKMTNSKTKTVQAALIYSEKEERIFVLHKQELETQVCVTMINPKDNIMTRCREMEILGSSIPDKSLKQSEYAIALLDNEDVLSFIRINDKARIVMPSHYNTKGHFFMIEQDIVFVWDSIDKEGKKDLRIAWRYFNNPDVEHDFTITGDCDQLTSLKYSKNKHHAFLFGHEAYFLLDLNQKKLVHTHRHCSIEEIIFSPDLRFVAFYDLNLHTLYIQLLESNEKKIVTITGVQCYNSKKSNSFIQ